MASTRRPVTGGWRRRLRRLRANTATACDSQYSVISRRTSRFSIRRSIAVPICSESLSQENFSASDTPATSAAIHTTPDPAKPSSFMLAGPSR